MTFGLFTLALSADSSADNVINSEDHAEGVVSMHDANTLTKAELRAQKRQERKLLRQERREFKREKRRANAIEHIQKKLVKKQEKLAKKGESLGGIGDPVDKWFWYWLIAWGAALVLNIVFWAAATSGAGLFSGGWLLIGLLSTLLWLGGIVCLIIWLINKFG